MTHGELYELAWTIGAGFTAGSAVFVGFLILLWLAAGWAMTAIEAAGRRLLRLWRRT